MHRLPWHRRCTCERATTCGSPRARGAQPAARLHSGARVQLCELAVARGDVVAPPEPHFLWVTEFPLFTRADEDKERLAHGRWSSSHHLFTAPMWEDVGALYEAL